VRWRAILALALVASLAATVPAAAKPVDAASATKALRIWLRYANSAKAAVTAAKTSEDDLVASVANGCPGVLGQIDSQPADQWNWRALSALADEATGNSDLAAGAPLHAGFGVFAKRIGALRWSKGSTRSAVKRSLQLQRRYLFQAPSDMCADANALAANGGASTPTATLQFDAVIRRNFAGAGLLGLGRIIFKFAKHTHTNQVLNQKLANAQFDYQSATLDLIGTTQGRLLKTLGLNNVEAFVGQDQEAMSNARNQVSEVESCYTDTMDYRRCTSSTADVEVVDATKESYRVIAHSKTGTDFVIDRKANGTVDRTCTRPGVSTCGEGGVW
jgi:hypothetical protein